MSASGTVIDQLIIAIGGDATGLSKVFDDVKSQTNKLESTVNQASKSLSNGMGEAVKKTGGSILDLGMKLGTGIFAFKEIAGTAIETANALLEPNASMEQLQIAFTTLFKSSDKANAYLQKLSDFAASTPFEMPQVAEAAQKLLAMGTNANDVIPILTDIGDAMSGLGRGAQDVSDIVTVFGQMQMEGKVTADNMNQLTDRGVNAWGFLAKAMGKTVPEVRKLSEQGLIPANDAIKMIRQGMHDTFGGGMDAQAKSFNGIMSTIHDNIMKAWLAFSGPAFTAAKDALNTVGNIVSGPQFQGMAKSLGEGVNKAFEGIGKLVAPLGKLFSTAFAPLNDEPFGVFLANLQALGDTIGKWFGPILQGIGTSFKAVFGGDGATAAQGFADWLSTTLYSLGDTFAGMLPTIDQFGKAIVQWLADGNLTKMLQDFKNTLSIVGGFIQENIVPAVMAALPGFLSLGNTIATVVIPAIAGLVKGNFDTFMNIAKAVMPVVAAIIPVLIQFAGILAGAVAQAIQFLTPYISAAIAAVQQFAGEIAERVAPLVMTAFQNIQAGIQQFATFWGFVWPGISLVLEGVWDTIVGVVQIAWALLSGIIKVGLDVLNGDWGKAWEDIKNMLKGIWDGFNTLINGQLKIITGTILAAGGAVLSAITSPFKDAVGKVQGFLNDIANKIRSWVPPALSMPSVPGIGGHAAGIMNNPVGHVAWVGEKGPELMYVPKGASIFSHQDSMGMISPTAAASISTGGSNGGGGNQTFIFDFDGQTFARMQGRYTDREVRLQLQSGARF